MRVNNALRSAIDAAMGSLTLGRPDPAKRIAAADAVFKSHDPKALPASRRQLAKETDPRAAQALDGRRAPRSSPQSSAPDAERLAAIARLEGARRSGRAEPARPDRSRPRGPGQDAPGCAALASIKRASRSGTSRRTSGTAFRPRSVLLLAAIGLAITFGVMGVINMAHGEMVMLGAYTTFIVQNACCRRRSPNGRSLIAIPLAFLVAGCVGIAIERLVIRFLYGRPLETLLATWGVSLILQQAVRTIFGANNRQVSAPAFMSGLVQRRRPRDHHRAGCGSSCSPLSCSPRCNCVLRATSFGLRMRAVTQNRRMASAMGISTGRIDMLAFGLGSGIAGIAGVALSQIDNVSPNLGQGYIIDSFMVVVLRRRRQSLGHVARRPDARRRQQAAGAVRRRGARQDHAAGLHHSVHPEAPARPVRAEGPGGGGMIALSLPRRARLDSARPFIVAMLASRRSLVPMLALAVPASSAFAIPPYVVALLGKYLCYALLALALDLVWGYCGILSLGHGAFFALGGYAMGMYLMRQIGARGVYANPILPDFMVFLNWKDLPVTWWGFNFFPYAMADGACWFPALLAFAFGWFAFRSRVTGVYLSIITQAMTYALKLAFFRNDFGFGGNNGLTDFKDILGFNVQADATQRGAVLDLGDRAGARLSFSPRRSSTSKFGKALIAVRDAESRVALPRLPRRKLQALRLRRLGDDGRHRRRALRAAGRHHQPFRIRARPIRSRR